MERVGTLRIESVPAVDDLAVPFGRLVEVDNDLILRGVWIENLELPSLVSVRRDVRVYENARLVALDGLARMERVGRDLFITQNPSLASEPVRAWAQELDVEGVVSICHNLGGVGGDLC